MIESWRLRSRFFNKEAFACFSTLVQGWRCASGWLVDLAPTFGEIQQCHLIHQEIRQTAAPDESVAVSGDWAAGHFTLRAFIQSYLMGDRRRGNLIRRILLGGWEGEVLALKEAATTKAEK